MSPQVKELYISLLQSHPYTKIMSWLPGANGIAVYMDKPIRQGTRIEPKTKKISTGQTIIFNYNPMCIFLEKCNGS